MGRSYLVHHGVKGQKWGIRNGPPYPLTESAKSKVTAQQFVENCSSRKLSDCTGRLLTSRIRLAFERTTFGQVVRMVRDSKKDRECRNDTDLERRKNKSSLTLENMPRLSEPMDAKESMKLVNPGYPTKKGTTNNCLLCTTAMVLREKGYNVKAGTSVAGLSSSEFWKKTFNANEITTTPKTAFKDTASLGDGAYGALRVHWTTDANHAVFWKVQNGKTHIYDGQTGEEYTSSATSTREFMSHIDHVGYYRLDNHNPTEYVTGVVESAEEGK